ncbi:hypothetical protein PQJ75_20455 [Rhodoplanes sp. TEM]|uniref:Uncharacterized protein n=1 Tax=Rhodoplanes tepidamans TaxID=200616 RepID=A0ABT5JIF1_RHOTP|nr:MULTISPECIES: hypothetical protein [Rhodoplanes]MDC7789478.1 hypothetical protein [Rhodoplanes tepidamans]MDC7986108.1 hypothetical protein [Rhodoplanes sp. TEM]MDQ0358895.1 hypothetical protein [Rhodoplanes tepidamans]
MRHHTIDLVRGGTPRDDTPRGDTARAAVAAGGPAAGALAAAGHGAPGLSAPGLAVPGLAAPGLAAAGPDMPGPVTSGPDTSGPDTPDTGDVTLRRRLERDAQLAVRLVGLAYMLLWLITWWVLGHGAAVLGSGSGCRLQRLSDLVLWRCTDAASVHMVADLVNGVLASTVWAPAVVMAAAVQPEVRLAAAVVIALHLVGLPAALLLAIRFGARLCDRIARRTPAGDAAPAARASRSGPATRRAAAPPVRAKRVPPTPRATFGLRQAVPR